VDCEARAIPAKLGEVKKMWTSKRLASVRRALLFVPSADDVKSLVGMLRFWGLSECVDLQVALGLASSSDDRAAKVPTAEEVISRAQQSRLGSPSTSAAPSSAPSGGDRRELFVAPVSGTRGLHLQDVDYVFLTHVPRSMDEYLHMAGRTGRSGNKQMTGTVVSFVNYDELKRLQSWQVPLGISFDVEYA
jgi:superfamily II DNA/RNA helicase